MMNTWNNTELRKQNESGVYTYGRRGSIIDFNKREPSCATIIIWTMFSLIMVSGLAGLVYMLMK